MKKLFSLVLSLVLAFGYLLLVPLPIVEAAADTCTWTGATDANWSTGTNWSGCDNGGVPESGDSLVFPSGASNLTNTNDIVGLDLDTITVSGNNYIISGNSVVLTPPSSTAVLLSGNSINFNLSINVTSSSSHTIYSSGSGNSMSGVITLTMPTSDMNVSAAAGETLVVNATVAGSARNFIIGTSGTGTVRFTAANTFTVTGDLYLNNGSTLDCRDNNCAGDSGNSLLQNGTSKLYFGSSVIFPNDITLNNLADSTAVSIEVPDSVGVSYSGAISMNGPSQIQLGSGTNLQLLSTTADLDFTLEIIGNTAATSFFRNTITPLIGSGELSCLNVACEMETNSVSYNGVIRAKAGSIVRPEIDNALGSTVGNTIIESGAQLQIQDGADLTIPENINVVGTGISSNGAIRNEDTTGSRTFSGTITLAGNTTIFNQDVDAIGPAANLIFSGVIDGTGDLTLTGSGFTEYIQLTGTSANTYVGKTIISNGQVVLGKLAGVNAIPGDLDIVASTSVTQLQDNGAGFGGDQIDDSSNVFLSEAGGFNAEVQVGGGETIGSLAGDGDIYIVGGETFNIGANNSSTTYTGKLTTTPNLSGVVNKIGTGNLTLNGTPTATFVPTYTVNGGTLTVMNDFTDAPFTVGSGGTLKGTGLTGDTAILSGGTFNAGTSPGCITAATLTLNSGANFDEEITGATACTEYDRTTVTGSANLGNAILNVIPSYTPAPGTIFTIIQASSVTGTFNGLPDNSQFTVNGLTFRINYTNTQVNLTYISGTLAQTGQSANWINILATILLVSSAVGLLIIWWHRRILQKT